MFDCKIQKKKVNFKQIIVTFLLICFMSFILNTFGLVSLQKFYSLKYLYVYVLLNVISLYDRISILLVIMWWVLREPFIVVWGKNKCDEDIFVLFIVSRELRWIEGACIICSFVIICLLFLSPLLTITLIEYIYITI